MASAAAFNIFIAAMFWSALAIFGLAMALMVLLLVVRIRAIARRRRTARVVAFWRGIFTGARPNVRRRIAWRDAFTVLNLWNDFQRVRAGGAGIAADALAAVAAVQGFDRLAQRLLTRGDAGDRLVAMTFLGYFPAAGSEPALLASSRSEYGELAIAAHRALVALDPVRMRGFAEAIAARDDFRPRTVEHVLKAIGPHVTSKPMAEVLLAQPGAARARMLRYFPLLDGAVAHPALISVLNGAADPDVIAAALRALTPFGVPADRPVIRHFLAHEAAFVRVAALGALLPVCDEDDREIVMTLVRDSDSWVRYRAAQALLERFSGDGEEGDLRREVADRYARDALTQVLAERSVVALREFVAAETGATREPEERGARIERRPMHGMRAGSL